MEVPQLHEAVLRILARDHRYAPDAFVFLHEGLMATLDRVQKKEKKPRHVSGAELSDGLRRHALEQYGPLALTVLARWGLRATRDFGEIVFLLLDAGLLRKTAEDKLEDFDDVYDFETAFRAPFRPKPRPRIRKPATSKPRSCANRSG